MPATYRLQLARIWASLRRSEELIREALVKLGVEEPKPQSAEESESSAGEENDGAELGDEEEQQLNADQELQQQEMSQEGEETDSSELEELQNLDQIQALRILDSMQAREKDLKQEMKRIQKQKMGIKEVEKNW